LADRVVDALGVGEPRLTADDLLAGARRRTGLTDFGSWPIEAPLRVLLAAYDEEAALSVFGRMAARWDILRFLSNLLQLHAAEQARPDILREPVVAPVFITGLPRSGTTFLHALLAEDPASLVPQCWQTIFPYPGPVGEEARIREVDRQLRLFESLAPDIRSVHQLSAQAPQECTEITAQVFLSLRFDTTHHVPSYRRWLDRVGHRTAYSFHRRFLQHLQSQRGGGRWMLKSPDHVFALDAILGAYPDARVVFVHRDPVKVLSSVTRLTEILRAPFARQVDRIQIGRQVCDHWLEGVARMMQARLPAGQLVHVQYRELTSAPLQTISRLYEALDVELSSEARARMQQLVEEKPNGGYGHHQYQLADYGLDPEEMRVRFSAYAAHFDIDPETEHA
jgi:hypothetical protein